jgi:hypothetical protein
MFSHEAKHFGQPSLWQQAGIKMIIFNNNKSDNNGLTCE